MSIDASRMTTLARLRHGLLLGACPFALIVASGIAEAQQVSAGTTQKKPAHVVHRRKPATQAAGSANPNPLAVPVGPAAGVPAAAAVARRRPSAAAPADLSESVIVTGSRVSRKARDSTTPVDVISARQLERTGSPNLTAALALADASINVHAIGTDTAALTSSIRLRGLSPDETLVLIDGKRRHTTGNITADGGPEGGATPVDINLIPAAAIDHIEVLRDGAAAQYGSDAIAGVVNIILKKNNKGSITAQTGANAYNGDGWTYQVDADKGFYFGSDGYIHLGFQAYHADHFVVHAVDDRLAGLNVPPDSNQEPGTPEETRQTASLSWGSTIAPDVLGGLQTYGFVTYGRRYGETYENYRLPSVLPQVYPNGFEPLETDFENDYAATVGFKAPDVLGFHVDVSSTWGQDDVTLGDKHTVNVSLYKQGYAPLGYAAGFTPDTFTAQTIQNSEWTSNLDVTRAFHVLGVANTLAFGAEARLDTYHLGAGDPASYILGGAQAYVGLTPASAGEWHRNVWAAYIDDDLHPLPNWDVDLAGRYEYYTDTDHTFTGKVSSRYDFTRWLAIRGTVGNGFRAPTLAEEHYSVLNVSATGASGTLAVNSDAARSIGAVPLKPERSYNMSAGVVVEPVRDMSVTLDVYQINIRDRVVFAGGVNGQSAVNAIGLTGTVLPEFSASQINGVSATYFANGASTRTQGLDLNWGYLTRLGRWGTVNWSADLDLNRTRVSHVGTDSQGNPFINAQGVSYLSTASPRSKLILDAYWKIGRFDVNARQTRWGQTSIDMSYSDQAPVAIRYSNKVFRQFVNTPRWTTDLEVGYQATASLHVAVGGNNLFNIRPRELPPILAYLGANIYATGSAQVPVTGGFYYGRINYSF